MSESNLLQDTITKVTLDTMVGIRRAVGECRTKEFASFIATLIAAKKAELSTDTILFPMLSDNVKQGVEAALSSRTNVGVGGGVTWQIAELNANYGTEKSQGIKVKVDMSFMSTGAPDFQILKAMTVPELEQLLLVVDKPTA